MSFVMHGLVDIDIISRL